MCIVKRRDGRNIPRALPMKSADRVNVVNCMIADVYVLNSKERFLDFREVVEKRCWCIERKKASSAGKSY